MSRAKFPLPIVTNPTKSRYVCVQVPDDIGHRQAFAGALYQLAKAYKWEDDDAHTAIDAAATWMPIWYDVMAQLDLAKEQCGTPPQPAQLIGEDLEDDVQLCDHLRYQDGKLQALCFCCSSNSYEWVDIQGQDGGIVPPGTVQPGGADRPAAGASKCYDVLLNGNSQWLLPFAALPGDTITISDWSGSWHPGGVSPWYCSTGDTSVFGWCSGAGKGHATGDPSGTAYHMELVANVGGTWYSGTSGAITAGGSGSQQVTFQANDSDLTDNSGSIKFKVCVTSGETPPATTWCYTLDFTASDYGWNIDTPGSYVLGTGFVAASYNNGSVDVTGIGISAPAGLLTAHYTGLSLEFDYTLGTFTVTANAWLRSIDSAAVLDTGTSNGHVTWSWTGDVSSPSAINYYLRAAYNATDGAVTITRLTLTGIGTNPFGSSNC